MYSYLNFASDKYLPHPSLFIIKDELRVNVENCPFFHTVYWLWIKSKELVCIGGVEQKNYCYDNSKIEAFLNLDENKYLLKMPYLSTSIYYQILKIYSLEKDSLKKTAYKLALDNVNTSIKTI